MALLSTTAPSLAQNTMIIGGSGSSGVYINEQLIGSAPAYSNSYSYGSGPGNIPSGYPGSTGSEYLNRPGNLLYPPQNYPHSQITIQNFSDFQTSGYAPQGNGTQGYNNQGYSASAYSPQGYHQPGLASGSSLYNPYGQPLVPLAQVSKTRVASTGGLPQYPTQVPAFQPQSQLLVPPPAGRAQTATPARTTNTASIASTPAPSTPKTIIDVTPPAAPKAPKTVEAPLQITPTQKNNVPSPITPPAPKIVEVTPPKPEPVAKAPTPPKLETVTAKVVAPPKPEVTKSPAPAPVIETVTSEPVLAPPPVPAPVTADATSSIPSAPAIAEPSLVESTAELAPPPAPLNPPTTETAAIDLSAPLKPMKLFFQPDQADLSNDARSQLNQLADVLLADDSRIIQLLAYASDNESGAQARRVSLSRALAVRGVLMERGIQSTRMHVRALGNKSKDGNPDRVEIIPVKN
ncbi:OmpA family protein [Kiloniella antarctica]|uniref:OmpA family protein n=1 Tax=Kiloniella antarctica TaxID=1550907 RepID=A0ABW5BDF3_9PROT